MQYKLRRLLEILHLLLYDVSEVKYMREQSQKFDPRQVMRRDSFEVFHYRQPKPGGVDVHHHDFYEVYFLLDGEVEYWVDGRILKMVPGDLLLINPMELHRPVVTEETRVYERIVVWINREYLESLGNGSLCGCFDHNQPDHTHLIRLTPSERTGITALLGELVRESYSREFGSEISAHGLLLQFMVRLNRLARHTGQPEESRQQSALVQQVLAYIGEHLAQNMSLEDLADRFFVSKYYLSHTFSREVGVSLYRYIMLRRLLLARQLLGQGMPAGKVSESCGFTDYTSFYRAFKSEYGISPREL
jgi:AraC-like DNA-binding protein/mannose-6-phosphate isomerase-like protein (cupin superfamily)